MSNLTPTTVSTRARTMILILFSMIFAFFKACAQDTNTIEFTRAEVQEIAAFNLQRKACLKDNRLLQMENDSLRAKITLYKEQIGIKQAETDRYMLVVESLNDVDKIRVIQVSEFKEKNEELQKINDKQHRKLTFWRVFTPVAITAEAIILTIFVK